jgi:XTP/dITP diphosphohydrolase
LATRNRGKLAEYRRLLGGAGVALLDLDEAGVGEEVEEDGATFLANASRKAREYARLARLPVLADDSGLVVDALGGDPGVRSARFGGPGLDDAGRIRHLLARLGGVADRRARFVCVIALARPGGPAARVYLGQCDGRIGREPRGPGGFGYDPVFVLPDGRTMAELPDGEKDQISHRGLAVAELLAQLDLAAWAAVAAPPVTSQAT